MFCWCLLALPGKLVWAEDADGDGVEDVVPADPPSDSAPENTAPAYDPFTDPSADPDGDGLYNWEEDETGANKLLADSDGDGLSDGLEVHDSHTSPLLADSDQDGWTDYQEHYPDADPDGDLLENALEWQLGSDIFLVDSDYDGLTDNDEARLSGTSPIDADSDDNGLTDYQEYFAPSAAEMPASESGGEESASDTPGGTEDGNQNSNSVDEPGSSPEQTDSGTSSTENSATNEATGASDGTSPEEQPAATSPDVTIIDDQDGDGLTDDREAELGSSPASNDTDGDGLLDGPEVQAGLNPLTPDTDGDFLTDFEEGIGGAFPAMNPLTPDTDGDGRWDYLEVSLQDFDGGGIPDRIETFYGMNPWAPSDETDGDLDGDGIKNVAEYNDGFDLRGSYYETYDSDSDGMTNAYELTYGLNPNNPLDAVGDADHDGIMNFEEAENNLSPYQWNDPAVIFGADYTQIAQNLDTSSDAPNADWDGDGQSNFEETQQNGTDPRKPPADASGDQPDPAESFPTQDNECTNPDCVCENCACRTRIMGTSEYLPCPCEPPTYEYVATEITAPAQKVSKIQRLKQTQKLQQGGNEIGLPPSYSESNEWNDVSIEEGPLTTESGADTGTPAPAPNEGEDGYWVAEGSGMEPTGESKTDWDDWVWSSGDTTRYRNGVREIWYMATARWYKKVAVRKAIAVQ